MALRYFRTELRNADGAVQARLRVQLEQILKRRRAGADPGWFR